MKKIIALSRTTNPKFLLAAASSGIAFAMSVGLIGTSAWLISMASMKPPVLVLEVAIVSVRFFGLSRGFFRYFGRIQEHASVLKLQTKLRSHLYQSFELKLPSEFFGIQRGSLLHTMVGDTETVLDLWIRVASPWISALISGVAGLGIIYYLLPSAGLALSAIFIVTITACPWFSYRLSSNEGKADKQEELVASLISTFDSLPESIVFNRVEGITAKVEGLQNELNALESKSSSGAALGDFLITAATGLSVVLALFFASRGFMDHNLAGVNVAVIALLPLAIFDGLTGLPMAFSQLPALVTSADRLNTLISVMEVKPEVMQDHHSLDATLEVQNFLPAHLRGKIEPLNFTAASGQTLLISGKSGIGKSSIVHSLAGLSEFDGEILLNGSHIAALPADIATIGLQVDHLFQSSIRENLRIAREGISDREMEQMLEIVELNDLIASLPDGLDTHIGAYGHNFSGGERQRLKLARALLRHTPIFILDEPFEFLDLLQAKRIAKRVSTILTTKTVIIISHIDLGLAGEVLRLND